MCLCVCVSHPGTLLEHKVVKQRITVKNVTVRGDTVSLLGPVSEWHVKNLLATSIKTLKEVTLGCLLDVDKYGKMSVF